MRKCLEFTQYFCMNLFSPLDNGVNYQLETFETMYLQLTGPFQPCCIAGS